MPTPFGGCSRVMCTDEGVDVFLIGQGEKRIETNRRYVAQGGLGSNW